MTSTLAQLWSAVTNSLEMVLSWCPAESSCQWSSWYSQPPPPIIQIILQKMQQQQQQTNLVMGLFSRGSASAPTHPPPPLHFSYRSLLAASDEDWGWSRFCWCQQAFKRKLLTGADNASVLSPTCKSSFSTNSLSLTFYFKSNPSHIQTVTWMILKSVQSQSQIGHPIQSDTGIGWV